METAKDKNESDSERNREYFRKLFNGKPEEKDRGRVMWGADSTQSGQQTPKSNNNDPPERMENDPGRIMWGASQTNDGQQTPKSNNNNNNIDSPKQEKKHRDEKKGGGDNVGSLEPQNLMKKFDDSQQVVAFGGFGDSNEQNTNKNSPKVNERHEKELKESYELVEDLTKELCVQLRLKSEFEQEKQKMTEKIRILEAQVKELNNRLALQAEEHREKQRNVGNEQPNVSVETLRNGLEKKISMQTPSSKKTPTVRPPFNYDPVERSSSSRQNPYALLNELKFNNQQSNVQPRQDTRESTIHRVHDIPSFDVQTTESRTNERRQKVEELSNQEAKRQQELLEKARKDLAAQLDISKKTLEKYGK